MNILKTLLVVLLGVAASVLSSGLVVGQSEEISTSNSIEIAGEGVPCPDVEI